MADDEVTNLSARAGKELETLWWEACFVEDLHKLGGDGGSFAGWFDDDSVASDECGDGHANEDGEGEVPGRNDDAHAEAEVGELSVFAGHLDEGFGLRVAQHLACVVVAEIDSLSGVGFCLQPVLAGLENHPGVELALAALEDCGGAEEAGGALLGGNGAPGGEVGVGKLDSAIGLLGCGLLMDADQF